MFTFGLSRHANKQQTTNNKQQTENNKLQTENNKRNRPVYFFVIPYRDAGSNLGQRGRVVGGGAASRKRAPYITLANKEKSQNLKNSLSSAILYLITVIRTK